MAPRTGGSPIRGVGHRARRAHLRGRLIEQPHPGFQPARQIIRSWGGRGSVDGKFSYPCGIATDPQGRVYVVDGSNHRIQMFNARGRFIRSWGREGSANGSFRDPRDVAIDRRGRVLVTDTGNARVQVFTRGGRYRTKWSAATIAPVGFNPMGVAVDSSNRIYIADTASDRVEVFTTTG